MSKIFTLDDITHFPDNDGGWFYGLVKDGKKILICEIHPGIGFSNPFLSLNPKIYFWMIRDIFTQLFSKKDLPRLSDDIFLKRKQNREQEIREAKTWNPDKESLSSFLDND